MAMEAYLIKEHNTNVLKSLKKGDLVEIKRSFLYSHWAVYVGNKKVIHLTVDDNSGSSAYGSVFTICGRTFDKALVKKEKFWKVVDGFKCYKNNSKDKKMRPDKAREILKRGLDMVDKKIEYNVLWSNCEHFASFCRYGQLESGQTDYAWVAILAIAASIVWRVGGALVRS